MACEPKVEYFDSPICYIRFITCAFEWLVLFACSSTNVRMDSVFEHPPLPAHQPVRHVLLRIHWNKLISGSALMQSEQFTTTGAKAPLQVTNYYSYQSMHVTHTYTCADFTPSLLGTVTTPMIFLFTFLYDTYMTWICQQPRSHHKYPRFVSGGVETCLNVFACISSESFVTFDYNRLALRCVGWPRSWVLLLWLEIIYPL